MYDDFLIFGPILKKEPQYWLEN